MSRWPAWTEAQDDLLREGWGCVSDADLARRIGRGVGAVQSRAHALALRRTDAFLTASEVGRLCGVDSKSVVSWLRRGVLVGHKAAFTIARHRPWRIEIADFEAFLREHPGWYRPERVTAEPWAGIVRQTLAADPLLTVDDAARLLGCAHETIVRQCRSGYLRAERVANSGHNGTWYLRRSALAGWQRRRPGHVALQSIAGYWGQHGPKRRLSRTPLAVVPPTIARPRPAPVERQRTRYRPVTWRVS